MSKQFPLITIAIPTYNEEKNLQSCLESIFHQNYPLKKLEVFVVDDGSQDKTLAVAKKFPVKILHHHSHDGEVGKMIAFQKSQGEFFYYLDADCQLKGKNWFQKMIKPLRTDPTIVASFTRKYSGCSTPALERYYNFDPIQRDPIYQYFSPSIASTVVKEEQGWQTCLYTSKKIPPAGRCLHRRSALWPLVKNYRRFLELDFLVILVEGGFNRFAYVPQAGIYHHHVKNLIDLAQKRLRNVKRVYLSEVEIRKYRWFDLKKFSDLIKILTWVIYAHLIIPALFRGVWLSFRHHDWAGLYEPIVTLFVTDVIIWGFLTSSKTWVLLEKRA